MNAGGAWRRTLAFVLAIGLALLSPVRAAHGQQQPPRPQQPAKAPPQVSKADSLARVIADSLLRLRADSIGRARAGKDTIRAKAIADSIVTAAEVARRKESIGRGGLDSAKVRLQVEWGEPDSVISALLGRKGYSVMRYQGKNVVFKAQEHTMNLVGTIQLH